MPLITYHCLRSGFHFHFPVLPPCRLHFSSHHLSLIARLDFNPLLSDFDPSHLHPVFQFKIPQRLITLAGHSSLYRLCDHYNTFILVRDSNAIIVATTYTPAGCAVDRVPYSASDPAVFRPGESASDRQPGTQLRPAHPSFTLPSVHYHRCYPSQILLPPSLFHLPVTLHPPQYIDIPFPAQNARAGPAIATIFFHAGSDHVGVDAGVCSATKAYVRFFVFFSSLRHSTIPLAAVWFFTPYSLSPFPASPWRSLSRSPLPPLPFALVVLRYRYQRPCSSPSHWPNVSVITIAGCSDSGLITFVLPLAFLSIPTPVIPLISSRFLPLEHFYDSTPFSPHPMLRTHPPQSPISPCALVCFFGLDIPLLGMPRYAAFHFYLDLCPPSPSRDTIYLLCILYRASLLVPLDFATTILYSYVMRISLNATALHYSTIESP
ncbi:hypothetical protein B0H13DRAFT_2328487 [Mycena leptocephala]|nr:hypothetical protein B0H13DRAFT_2328487 [Mycena leptocephala]